MFYKGVKISVVYGDLCDEDTEAIVHTANG